MQYLNCLNFLIIISILIYILYIREERFKTYYTRPTGDWTTNNNNNIITLDDNGDLHSISNSDLLTKIQNSFLSSGLFIPKNGFGYAARSDGMAYIYSNHSVNGLIYNNVNNTPIWEWEYQGPTSSNGWRANSRYVERALDILPIGNNSTGPWDAAADKGWGGFTILHNKIQHIDFSKKTEPESYKNFSGMNVWKRIV